MMITCRDRFRNLFKIHDRINSKVFMILFSFHLVLLQVEWLLLSFPSLLLLLNPCRGLMLVLHELLLNNNNNNSRLQWLTIRFQELFRDQFE